MVKRINKIPLLLFLFLSVILIFSWFRFGYIYGGGDTGLPTYSPQAAVNIASNIWWDSLAPGIPVAQGLTSVPMMFFLSIPQALGASPVFIQGFLFFILLFMMGYGMYLLALSIFSNNTFGRSRYLLAISAGVFYLFNPYMMIQIWHRFIYNSIVLVAFLPFLVWTWLWWIRKRQPVYLLLFLLVNFLAVYMYGTIAFIVAVWILLFFLTLLEVLIPWKGRKITLKLFLTFFIGLLFWLLTNSWWFIPTFSISPALFAEQHSTDDSLSTLLELSSQTILPYTLRLSNPFYLYWNADWGDLYQSIPFLLISWLFVLVIFVGFLKGFRQKTYASWSLLALVVIFLSKGAAPPFNFPYIFGFSHFFPLGVIRNPFEKLGILQPLSFAILFALGLQVLLNYSDKSIGKSKTYLLLVIFILFNIAFFWPMLTGKVFGTLDKSAFVEVPKSYTQANDWISKNLGNTTEGEGKILHLPLSRSEDATYNWQYGYHGVEPSAAIFTSLPSIARGLNVYGVDDALSGLSYIFAQYPQDVEKIVNLLQSFNIRFVILHKDMEWRGGYLTDPKSLETILDSLKFLERKKQFEDLAIYELKDEFFAPRIRFTNNVQYLVRGEENLYWPWLVKNDGGDLLSGVNSSQNNLEDFSNQTIVIAENIYLYNPYPTSLENAVNELPAIRFLPNSSLYPLIKLKEKIMLFTMPEIDKFIFRITLAGKRLVEAYKVKEKKEAVSIKPQLVEYSRFLPKLKMGILARKGTGLLGGEVPLESIFARHLVILDSLLDQADNDEKIQIEETKNQLIIMLKQSNLMPFYKIEQTKDLPDKDRLVLRFKVPFKGRYEIVQAHQGSQDIYPDLLNNIELQIDQNILKPKRFLAGNFISYGFIELAEGLHEINFHSKLSNNLFDPNGDLTRVGNIEHLEEEIAITSLVHEPGFIEFDINPVTGGEWYKLSFESWIKLGDMFKVQLIQDSDPIDRKLEEGRLLSFNKPISREPYGNFWNKYSFNLRIRPATKKAAIRLLVEPWDNCRIILVKKILCKSKEVRYRFERPSMVAYRNITLQRQLRNPLFLRVEKSDNTLLNDATGDVNFIQKNPTLYFGEININTDGFLIFSETFHPGWKLKLNNKQSNVALSPNYIANLYSNAWYLEKGGKYKFILQFEPQSLVKKGIAVSGIALVIVLILVVGYNIRRSLRKI